MSGSSFSKFHILSIFCTLLSPTFPSEVCHGADTHSYEVLAPANQPPVAKVGPDQVVTLLQGQKTVAVRLDGSGSYDPDGTIKAYNWSGPSHPAKIVNPLVLLPEGTYAYSLKVTDDQGAKSLPANTTITVLRPPLNNSPAANAGTDQTAYVTNTVQLTGAASTDVDGDTLAYRWSFSSLPLQSTATLANADSVNPSFIVDKPGNYVVSLIVNDGNADSPPDTVIISTENSPPVANAGPDQTTTVGTLVTLNGSNSSDVDGDPITYRWAFDSIPEGSSTTLTGAAAVNPSFNTDKPGVYILRLIVNDGKIDSQSAVVTISTSNSSPVANAGPNQTVAVGTLVALNGSGSTDVDGDPISYQWAFVSVPEESSATLTDAIAVNPSFSIDKHGVYVVQLIVNDGTVSSTPVTVTISTRNSPPVASAGPDQTVVTGTLVVLDGTSSSDVDDDELYYQWSFSSVPSDSGAALGNPTTVNPTFTVDKPGSYVLQLIVNDGTQKSAPATVTISTRNSAPVANLGQNQTVTVGSTVQLDGSGSSDVDGDSLTYQWALLAKPQGSEATISVATEVYPTFVADMAGTYVAQLIVNDGAVNSEPVTVTIATSNRAPVAVSITASLDEDTSVIIDPVALATDVDGDVLSVSALGVAQNGTVALNAEGKIVYTGNANYNGTDSFTYTITDGKGGFDTKEVNLTVNPVNDAPVAQDISASLDEDSSVIIDAVAIASDIDGDVISVSALGAAQNGTVALNAEGKIVYTANTNYNGTDSCTYTITDGKGGSDTKTVNLTVNPVNDAPVAQNMSASLDENSSVIIDPVTLASDIDGDVLFVSALGAATNGTVTMNADGRIVYIANANYYGSDAFNYTISDGNGGLDTKTVNLTINPVNHHFIGTTGDDVLTGTNHQDTINGLAGNDTLYGLAGDDSLIGGINADVMYGGTGNDVYTVDNIGDMVYESPSEGIDTITINSSIGTYTLPDNCENLTLTGSALNGTGNELDNVITGNTSANLLNGRGGNDQLIGSMGNDTYLFDTGDGIDTVTDVFGTDLFKFGPNVDRTKIAIFKDASGNLIIDYGNSGGIDQVTVSNWTNQIEKIQLSDGTYLTNTDINNIIQAMTAYASDNGITLNSVEDVKNNAELMNTWANSWHV